MRQFRLLKDTPIHKAGTIFKWDTVINKYMANLDNDFYMYYEKKHVENNDEWFEEVKEEPAQTFTFEGSWGKPRNKKRNKKTFLSIMVDGTRFVNEKDYIKKSNIKELFCYEMSDYLKGLLEDLIK